MMKGKMLKNVLFDTVESARFAELFIEEIARTKDGVRIMSLVRMTKDDVAEEKIVDADYVFVDADGNCIIFKSEYGDLFLNKTWFSAEPEFLGDRTAWIQYKEENIILNLQAESYHFEEISETERQRRANLSWQPKRDAMVISVSVLED